VGSRSGGDDGGTAATGAATSEVVGVVVGGWDGGAVAVASDDGDLWGWMEVSRWKVGMRRPRGR